MSQGVCDGGSHLALVILWNAARSLFNLSPLHRCHLVKRAPLPSPQWYRAGHGCTQRKTSWDLFLTNQNFFHRCVTYIRTMHTRAHAYTQTGAAEVIFCFSILNPPPISLSAVSITLILTIPPRLLYHPSISVFHFISRPLPPFLSSFSSHTVFSLCPSTLLRLHHVSANFINRNQPLRHQWFVNDRGLFLATSQT